MSALVDRIVSEAPATADVLQYHNFTNSVRLVAEALELANVAPQWIPYFTFESLSKHCYDWAAAARDQIAYAGLSGQRLRVEENNYLIVARRFHDKAWSLKPASDLPVAA